MLVRQKKRLGEASLGKTECERGVETTETIEYAAAKINRRCIGVVTGRTANFRDGITTPECLDQHLVIEDEVVGIVAEVEALEELPRERAVSRMILREFRAREGILDEGEEAIRHVPPPRHSAT